MVYSISRSAPEAADSWKYLHENLADRFKVLLTKSPCICWFNGISFMYIGVAVGILSQVEYLSILMRSAPESTEVDFMCTKSHGKKKLGNFFLWSNKNGIFPIFWAETHPCQYKSQLATSIRLFYPFRYRSYSFCSTVLWFSNVKRQFLTTWNLIKIPDFLT